MALPYRSIAAGHHATNVTPPDTAGRAAINPPWLLLSCALAAALLLLVPRFTRGYGIRPALADAGLTQLAQERFYRALDWGTSGVWAGADLPAMVVACKVLAVLGGCFALLRIIVRVTQVEGLALAAAALLIGLTYLDGGTGFIAGSGIASGGFTGAQLAEAVVLLSVALALDGSLVLGVALLGVAADANAGVALWGLGAIVGATVGLAWDGATLGRSWRAGGVAALVLALPALLWSWSLLGGNGLPSVHAATVALLQSHRWILLLLPLQAWVLCGCSVALGLAACSTLGPDGKALFGALLGVVVVFALGCILPFVTASPLLLGLRLIAADGLLQLLAATAAAAVVARDLRNARGTLRVALSVVVAACLLLHPYLLPFAALAMLCRAAAAHGELLGIERRIRDWNRVAMSRLAAGLIVLAALGGVLLRAGVLAAIH